MVEARWTTYEINDVETVVDNERILGLNEKHIEEKLYNKNLRERTTKYDLHYVKHRYDLLKEQKDNPIEIL